MFTICSYLNCNIDCYENSVLKVNSKMIRRTVSSSNIASIGYDPNSSTLEIEFHAGGIYQYFKVPANIHRDFMSASSHGTYFHEYIKDKYEYKKIS